jgi:hypothetical protein
MGRLSGKKHAMAGAVERGQHNGGRTCMHGPGLSMQQRTGCVIRGCRQRLPLPLCSMSEHEAEAAETGAHSRHRGRYSRHNRQQLAR